jgi:hypothetical protein
MKSVEEDLPPSAIAMGRWEDYCNIIKNQFFLGFDDGLSNCLPHKPKMSEAYSQGYSDGYHLAQMRDRISGVQDGF